MKLHHFEMLPEQAFKLDGKRLTLWGKGGDSPPTPDYAGAAQATAAGNLEAARAATAANRVNQYTPYGSLTYAHNPVGTFDQAGYDAALAKYNKDLAAYNAGGPQANLVSNNNAFGFNGGGNQTIARGPAPTAPNKTQYTNSNEDGGWSSTINLSPTGQQLLDYSNAASLGLGKQTQNALSRVDQSLSNPFDYGSVKDTQDAAYKAFTDRLDPQWDANTKSYENQLANQGIPVGSEAYNNAMRTFNQGKNDAYSQANLGAINTAPQTYQLAQALRNQPLNELNALRTGSQVNNPTFGSVPQQATTAGPDLLGATQAGYNADLGASNASNAAGASTMNGLMSIGSMAAMYF